MINGFKIYDADAHVNVAPQMWEDLPKELAARRPRPAIIYDGAELAAFTAGWITDGRVEPHALGPGLQPANPPRWVVEGTNRGSLTVVDPEARIRDLDRLASTFSFFFRRRCKPGGPPTRALKRRCFARSIDSLRAKPNRIPNGSNGLAWYRCVIRASQSRRSKK